MMTNYIRPLNIFRNNDEEFIFLDIDESYYDTDMSYTEINEEILFKEYYPWTENYINIIDNMNY